MQAAIYIKDRHVWFAAKQKEVVKKTLTLGAISIY